MQVAIFGAGGVGGYFGARMIEAGTAEVAFIARGAHLAALNQTGLKVESALGDVSTRDFRASDDPATIGPVDCVLFCVKLYDVESAGQKLQPLLGPDTRVITLQNGVDAPERLGAIIGPERVLPGIAYIASVIAEPGLIRHTGNFARLRFARPGEPVAEDLAAALVAAGAKAEAIDDIEPALWEKFIMLSAMSALTALMRLPIGRIRETPESWALVRPALEETAAVGRAMGVDLAADAVERQYKVIEGLPDRMKASQLEDLERGRRLELEWLSGTVSRLGRTRDVPTPIHDFAYAALRPFAGGSE